MPDRVPITEWDLAGAVLAGEDEAIAGLTEAFRRYGARTVEWGYRGVGENDDEPDPAGPVTWYCEIELVHRIRRRKTVRKLTAEVVGGGPDGVLHHQALFEAAARLIRQLGGSVEIVIED